MNRESLLDEAIAKAKESEDWQLVEWLRMARGGESAARWYTDKLREAHRTERRLLDANAKLRELCGFVLMFTTMTDGCGDTCPYSCNNCQNECYFRKMARELGVEVDG